jgi:hypothetical protein
VELVDRCVRVRDRLVEPLRRRDVGDADPEVVDVDGRAQPAVAHRLDAVAVGIEQERAVVVVAVLGARSRRTVVLKARFGPGAPELVDLLA